MIPSPVPLLAWLGLVRARRVQGLDNMWQGPVLVQGRLSCSRPLRSPIRGTECAGYLYKASHLGWRTVGPSSRKPMHEALVYASALIMVLDDGGTVALRPRSSNSFGPEGHQRLVERDFPGFRAREVLLREGQRISVYGVARAHADQWVVTFDYCFPKPASSIAKLTE